MDDERLKELCRTLPTAGNPGDGTGPDDELRLTRSLLSRNPPPAEPLPAVLVVQPGTEPRWLPLLKPAVSVGRHPGNDIVIDDPGVSREHCQLVLREGAWSVEDLGSHNGTVFRDRRVRDLELRSGDVLHLASALILFTDGLRWPPGPGSQPQP